MRVIKGTDPELFILGPDMKPVPAHRFFDDKFHKTVLPGGKAFRDGYAVEINVEPSPYWWTVTERVRRVTQAIQSMLPPDHILTTVPSVEINLADLRDAPIDVTVFGCDPSWDAYTSVRKVPDLDGLEHSYRYVGGHLHFSGEGITKKSRHWSTRTEDVELFVRMLDAYIGIPFAAMFNRPAMWERRKYYGQAGEYRHQKYPDGAIGIEYRTPGPEVFNHPALTQLAMEVGEHLFLNFHDYKHLWDPEYEPLIQGAINTGEGASDLVEAIPGLYSTGLIDILATNMPFLKFDLQNVPVTRNAWGTWVHNYMLAMG